MRVNILVYTLYYLSSTIELMKEYTDSKISLLTENELIGRIIN
jgi:hypothetical protein